MRKIEFSLIMATLNRTQEVEEFLNSINKSDYDLKNIEIIIVDQNSNNELDAVVAHYSKIIDIVHIKSTIRGVSKNRNIGIERAKGHILCFPDDDCQYVRDTLKKVEEEFKKNQDKSMVMGRIIDEKGNDSLKKWSKRNEIITKNNFFTKASSINIFLKKNSIFFDEKLGVGEFFGSCEDIDYIYLNLKKNQKSSYNPDIKIFHPQSSFVNFNEKKSRSYGLGFGAFCRKNFNLRFFCIFGMGIALTMTKILFFILKFDCLGTKIWSYNLKGRIEGFIKYKN